MKDVMEIAIDAIREVFNDLSVSPEITIENLIELRDIINEYITALESDLKEE